jgi:hypothetical protein
LHKDLDHKHYAELSACISKCSEYGI